MSQINSKDILSFFSRNPDKSSVTVYRKRDPLLNEASSHRRKAARIALESGALIAATTAVLTHYGFEPVASAVGIADSDPAKGIALTLGGIGSISLLTSISIGQAVDHFFEAGYCCDKAGTSQSPKR